MANIGQNPYGLWGELGKNGAMAASPVDLRRFPRVQVEAGFCLRFRLGPRRYFGLPVTTLGGGGCCIRVSTLLLGGLRPEAVLTEVYIEHPEIPQLPQRARITWVQEPPKAHEEPFVLVGIEYLEPDLAFIEAVDRCISTLLGGPVPGSRRPPGR